MSAPAVQFVINPETGRIIQKNGATYRRWKRRHPETPDLAPLPSRLLPPRLVPQVRYGVGSLRHPSAMPPCRPPAPGPRHLPGRSHSLPATFIPSPPPPLEKPVGSWTRRNAWGPDDLEALLKESETHSTDPGAISGDHDSDVMVDEILEQEGPSLLQAYQDPQVDFMDTLAETFGMTTNPSHPL